MSCELHSDYFCAYWFVFFSRSNTAQLHFTADLGSLYKLNHQPLNHNEKEHVVSLTLEVKCLAVQQEMQHRELQLSFIKSKISFALIVT